ncbi:MAG: patatin-like phospholipase family protein [Coriobacteriales bacterium]|nr:patatin-like phospholipase family protein [Actinomycetes bacterium]
MSLFGPRRIGLALGSGSARGLAHIGVLKVLEQEGLAPSVIAGTSMGALVGAFYAAGVSVDEMEHIALTFDVKQVTGLSDLALSNGAISSGEKVRAFLAEHLPPTFEELEMPFGCVAMDLSHNRAVYFTHGDLIQAVRASTSVPLAFVPVRMDDMLLVDGFVCDPVPVDLARQLGGETVVAVDVHGSGKVNLDDQGRRPASVLRDLQSTVARRDRERGDSSMDIVLAISEAFEARASELALRRASVVLSPEVHHLTGSNFAAAAEAIAAGEAAARTAVERIRRKARREHSERLDSAC